jgi:hypothetical protein
MSYAQKKELSGNRTLSIVFTIIVVGGLLYAIVTGLAYNVVKKTVQDLKTFDVEEPPQYHERLLDRLGFDVVRVIRGHREGGITRAQLAPRFRAISDEDLDTWSAFMVSRRRVLQK